MAGSQVRASEPAGASPSILLVSVDTLRADHLGVYGYPRGTDTRLRARLGRFDLFESAYTPLPLTVPAHAALMMGRYPRELGVLNNHHHVPSGEHATPTLAGLLAGAGYRTVAIVGSVVLSSVTDVGRGFGAYDEPPRRPGPARRTAGDVTERAMRIVESVDEPLFLFVHYYDVHPPHLAPPRYGCTLRVDDDLRRVLAERGIDGVSYHEVLNREHEEPVREHGRIVTLVEMVSRYDASVRYVTDQLSRLLEMWDATPHGAGGVVVITADHGEGLGQHGFWSHGMTLYDEVLRVPLLIRWPSGNAAPRRLEQMVSLLDIAPTLLEMVDIAAPRSMVGKSFLSVLRGDTPDRGPVFAQRMRYLSPRRPDGQRDWRSGDAYAIVDGRYKYLDGEGSAPALFDRGPDPFELRNLFNSRPRLVRGLDAALDAWLERVFEAEPVLTRGETDRERRERLRGLGYVD